MPDEPEQEAAADHVNRRAAVIGVALGTAGLGAGIGALIANQAPERAAAEPLVSTAAAKAVPAVLYLDPADDGALADGKHDDGPALTKAYARASKLATTPGFAKSVVLKLRPGKTYRIATSVRVSPWVTLDMTGAVLQGPITGAEPVTASTKVPDAADVAGQTAGACFTDDPSATTYGLRWVGGVVSDFRYGFCSVGTWAHPYWEEVSFGYCNIGIFAYQGIQEPKLINTVSQNEVGTTFVAAATCFASGNRFAHQDNFFCDGLVYDNHGQFRDSCTTQDAFDTWFGAAVLRPSTPSVTVSGSMTFSTMFKDPAILKPTGRNLYVPSRNGRLIFNPHIRRSASVNCTRGVALIGNPYGAMIQDVAGESMFAKGPQSVLLFPLSSGSPASGVIANIDSLLMTNPAKAAVEFSERVDGYYIPPARFSAQTVLGTVIGLQHLRAFDNGVLEVSGKGKTAMTDDDLKTFALPPTDRLEVVVHDTATDRARLAVRVGGRWRHTDLT